MKLLDVLLTSSAIQTFGWALLHSLWQGVVLIVLLKSALKLSKKAPVNTHYLLACGTLLLMLVLPVSTAIWSDSGSGNFKSEKVKIQFSELNKKGFTSPAISDQSNASETEFGYNRWIYQTEKQLLPWLVLLWIIGVFVSSLRLFSAWSYTQQLKLNSKPLVLEQWKQILQEICRQLQVSKPVALLESSLVKVPTVIGWLKPVILIPSCTLMGLTPQQFELILAHELAHIRRHDYLVNLFQTIIETILFYHPAVWWVSSQIRNERENACDDLAVSMGGGDAVAYARTLIEVERLRKANTRLVMAVDGGSLTMRIHRLVGVEETHSKPFAGVLMIILISILLAVVVVTRQNSFSPNSSLIKMRGGNESLLNLPPLTIEDLREGKQAAQKIMIGEWIAEFSRNNSGEIQLEIKKQSRGGGINGSINKLSPGELQGLSQDAMSSAKTNVTFSIAREAGIFVFDGYFSEGKGTGIWRLTPSPNFVSAMRSRGYDNLPENYLFYATTENVTPEMVDDMDAAGIGLSFKELIQAASYKITPESIRAWRSAGFDNLSFDELVRLGENEVTLEFLNEIKNEGFPEVSLSQAIKLKEHEIDKDFIRRARASGFSNATLKELIDLRINNIIE